MKYNRNSIRYYWKSEMDTMRAQKRCLQFYHIEGEEMPGMDTSRYRKQWHKQARHRDSMNKTMKGDTCGPSSSFSSVLLHVIFFKKIFIGSWLCSVNFFSFQVDPEFKT